MTPPVFAVRVLVFALTLPVAGALPAVAREQGPAPRWWKSEATVSELGLTPEQTARIDAIFENTVVELRQEWEELDRLEAKLSKMFQEDADETMLARQIDRVETARAGANKTRSLMLMRMRKVLTSEQRVRLETIFRRDRRPAPGASRPGQSDGQGPPAGPVQGRQQP